MCAEVGTHVWHVLVDLSNLIGDLAISGYLLEKGAQKGSNQFFILKRFGGGRSLIYTPLSANCLDTQLSVNCLLDLIYTQPFCQAFGQKAS